MAEATKRSMVLSILREIGEEISALCGIERTRAIILDFFNSFDLSEYQRLFNVSFTVIVHLPK